MRSWLHPTAAPTDRDHLNEYFSARTDFMVDVGDRRPALYFHGFTPDKKMSVKPTSNVIGKATAARTDDDGLWMEVELKEGRLADRVYDAAEAGTCRASTGCGKLPVPHRHGWGGGGVADWRAVPDRRGTGPPPGQRQGDCIAAARRCSRRWSWKFPEAFGEDTEPSQP